MNIQFILLMQKLKASQRIKLLAQPSTFLGFIWCAIVLLLQQIIKASDIWNAAIEEMCSFFCIPIRKEEHKQFTLTWNGQYLFIYLPQGYANSSALYNHIVWRDANCHDIP